MMVEVNKYCASLLKVRSNSVDAIASSPHVAFARMRPFVELGHPRPSLHILKVRCALVQQCVNACVLRQLMSSRAPVLCFLACSTSQ
jgi:hypothetical protein